MTLTPIQFTDLPCDIKSKIFAINTDVEREEHSQTQHKALIKELHRFFYFHQYDEERFPTFRCADMVIDYCMAGERHENVVFYSSRTPCE